MVRVGHMTFCKTQLVLSVLMILVTSQVPCPVGASFLNNLAVLDRQVHLLKDFMLVPGNELFGLQLCIIVYVNTAVKIEYVVDVCYYLAINN
jgi:hypothetical protein